MAPKYFPAAVRDQDGGPRFSTLRAIFSSGEKSKVVEPLPESAPETILVIRGAALSELSSWRIRPLSELPTYSYYYHGVVHNQLTADA